MIKINYETYEKPSDYYKLVEGINVFQIIGDGFITMKHGMRVSGRWIPLGQCVGENCPQCAKNNEAAMKYMWIVLDRIKGKVRLLESTANQGDIIAKFIQKHGTGTYDIELKRKGMDKNSTYELKKLEGKPLSDKEKQAINLNLKRLQLKYFK